MAVLKPSRHSLAELPFPEEGADGTAIFLLRIGNEPVPSWEQRPRTLTLDPADMKKLMHVST